VQCTWLIPSPPEEQPFPFHFNPLFVLYAPGPSCWKGEKRYPLDKSLSNRIVQLVFVILILWIVIHLVDSTYPTFEQLELDVVIVSSNRFMTHLKILLLLIVITTSKYNTTKKKRGERKKNYLHHSTCTNLPKMIFLTTCVISLTEFLTTLLLVQTMTVWRLLSTNNNSLHGSSFVLVWGKLQWWSRQRPRKSLRIIRDVDWLGMSQVSSYGIKNLRQHRKNNFFQG